ncbi:MAG: hypothetical protein PF448_12755 [Bacteroidales bacterium]|jgi:hypothetical protein|nr:hypothetical protein [Bacteroidales bacterium]
MKNLKILLVLAALVAVFSSCTEEYAEPTITWTPNDLSNYVFIGDESTYNKTLDISFSAEAGIADIEINKLVYKGLDLDWEASGVAPTGYSGLIDFDYNFTTNNELSDFEDGVTKIIYEVILVDASETPQETIKEYTFFVDEAYTVTINVEDEAGNEITDATVTFDGVELTAAPYAFEYIQEGTFEYTVEKAGYQTVTVSDFEMLDFDTTFTVTLMEELPTAWTGPIALTLESQVAWASYDGNPVTIFESEEFGFSFTATTESTITVSKTDNCDGWVLVDDITGFAIEADLAAAYTAGTALTTYDLPFNQNKAFETRYFVSKIGDNYLLVEYIDGHRDATTGNIVVFQYKD